MGFWSSISDKIIDITASGIVAVAVHVPFLLHALISMPTIPIGPTVYSVPEQPAILAPASTATRDPKPARQYSNYRAFPFKDYFREETDLLERGPYVNASSTHGVTLKLLIDEAHQSRNPSYEVYLDNLNVGEIAGQGISISKFSADQTHALIRTRNVMGCGGMCQAFNLYLLDFNHHVLTRIPLPQEKTGYESSVGAATFSEVREFVRLDPWVNNHEIAIESYFVGIGSDGKLYQTTGGDAWIYNLDTGTYRIYPGEE